MRKIIFALDNHFCDTAFSFARHVNEQDPVFVTGIYIPELLKNTQWSLLSGEESFYIPRLIKEEETIETDSVTAFKESCIKHNIHYQVYSDPGQYLLQGVQKETRFADLFIIGLDSYYQNGKFAEETLRNVIEYAECPILLVPKNAPFPDNIIVAYDGSENCVYTIKMFTYLFPALCMQPAKVIYASTHLTSLPDELYIKDLMSKHFSNVSYTILEFNPRKYFVTWMEENPNSMLIAGALHRSDLSQLFKASFIHDLLREHPVPIFIASR